MYGLVGYPVGHSFSAFFFNQKFEKENIAESYNLFSVEKLDKIRKIITDNPDLKGFNVTIPYKTEIISYLDKITPEAAEIGAVNVVKIIRDKTNYYLLGTNTDAFAFKDSLLPFIDKKNFTALILGTGGASKAVSYALKKLGLNYKFVSRNPSLNQLGYNDLDENLINNFRIIVNTTPLGMFPSTERCPELPYNELNANHLCYDLIYNPPLTLFLKKCLEAGAYIKNGKQMLELQALKSWELWNDPEFL